MSPLLLTPGVELTNDELKRITAAKFLLAAERSIQALLQCFQNA